MTKMKRSLALQRSRLRLKCRTSTEKSWQMAINSRVDDSKIDRNGTIWPEQTKSFALSFCDKPFFTILASFN